MHTRVLEMAAAGSLTLLWEKAKLLRKIDCADVRSEIGLILTA
jgi:hypothetical protein